MADFFRVNNNTFFGGDTNVRHRSFGDVSDNCYGLALSDLQYNTDLNIFNSKFPTFIGSGSFIDKFLTNSDLIPIGDIKNIGCFSDHMAISSQLPFRVPNTKIFSRKTFLFNAASVEKMNKFILLNLKRQITPIYANLPNGECEQLANNIDSIFSDAVKRFVPTGDTRHSILLSPCARSIQAAIKRNFRKLRAMGSLTPHFATVEIKNNIRLLRGMLCNIIDSETAKFFANAYNSIESNNDAFEAIRKYTGHKKRESAPSTIFENGDKISSVVGTENITNVLANNFHSNNNLTVNNGSCEAGNVFRSNLDIAKDNTIIEFGGSITPDILDDAHLMEIELQLTPDKRGLLTTRNEVWEIIKTRPNKNSTGGDLMPHTIIKTFNGEIIRCLTILFNHLIAISYFPRLWQNAIITPIPKPGRDISVVENWRSISMLSCLSKIFERIIAKRINIHTGTLEIFGNQYGFLNNNSTIHALANLQSSVNYGLNRGEVTTIVALDLQAAFDTVWHAGLLHKMLTLNYPIIIIKLIKSFLSHRSFVVRLDGFLSALKILLAGVPQGSVLGPICFNIYTYDIPTHSNVNVSQFADDTTLFITHKNPGLAQSFINSYLTTLVDWIDKWKLKLNKEKTELLHVLGQVRDTTRKLRRETRNMKISIRGHLLEHRNDIRLLGLQVQTNNRFTKNVKIRLQKARKTKFLLKRILGNKHIDNSIKTNIYKLYIRPILMYASPVWCRQP